MKIVFVSNYFSHHQRPLSDALAGLSDYTFVAAEQMTDERLGMGWGSETEPEYVCSLDSEPERASRCIDEADAVIFGSAPEEIARRCIGRDQLLFRYSERPLKNGTEPLKYLPRLVKWHRRNPIGKPIYLLSASAFASRDYALFGLFRGRAFKFGYFPEVREYDDFEGILNQKTPASILWAGRLLRLKHAEDAVMAAVRLREAGFDFEMNIIGSGEMDKPLRGLIAAEGLDGCVHMLGAMKPDEVRRCMERSEIYLFTSDRREGWGAVLNESMNSGCAVIASDAVGAVPYLVRDGENGFVYRSGDVDALCAKIKNVLRDHSISRRAGLAAYETMTQLWNARIAASRFVALAENILSGGDGRGMYGDGPCSEAEQMTEGWFEG